MRRLRSRILKRREKNRMSVDILVVDDEADIRELVSGLLEDEGFSPRAAADSDGAFAAVRDRLPALVVLDVWLQNSAKDGIEILEEFKKVHPELPVVIISGHGTIETAVTAIKKGAYDFVEKPFNADRLILAVNRALEAARLRRENLDLRERTPDWGLVGGSTVINASTPLGGLAQDYPPNPQAPTTRNSLAIPGEYATWAFAFAAFGSGCRHTP